MGVCLYFAGALGTGVVCLWVTQQRRPPICQPCAFFFSPVERPNHHVGYKIPWEPFYPTVYTAQKLATHKKPLPHVFLAEKILIYVPELGGKH